MKVIDLLKKRFSRLRHLPEVSALEVEWLDGLDSPEFRATMQEALSHLKATHARHWLADNQKMKSIPPADQQWVVDYWWPQFSSLGIQKIAVVESADAVNRLEVHKIMSTVPLKNGQEMRYFHNQHQAREWILGKPDGTDTVAI